MECSSHLRHPKVSIDSLHLIAPKIFSTLVACSLSLKYILYSSLNVACIDACCEALFQI